MVALVLAVTGASAGGFAGVLERRSISRRTSFIGSSERTPGITSKPLTGGGDGTNHSSSSTSGVVS